MPDRPEPTFHAPGPRVRWFSELLCGCVRDPAAPVRVLDAGCGTGDQLFDLAARLPRAQLVGVDVARANVEVARRRQAARADAARFAFHAADYRAFRAAEPFDLVISYSVLHLVPGDTASLAARVADDTAGGGVFANVMPYRCGYNAVLGMVRRILRSVRSRASDRLLLQAARALHATALDDHLLAERIAYAYAVPIRYDEDLARALEARGLRTDRRETVAHASPAQMKHALRVMRQPL